MTLVEMFENNPVFQNNSRNPQRDPEIQLAIAVSQFSSNGNGAAICQLENLFFLGYGTIDLYTKQIMKVLLPLWKKLLTWPIIEERTEFSQVMHKEGFLGCIGFIDGTTIPLSQKPAQDGNHYFDWKKRYGK